MIPGRKFCYLVGFFLPSCHGNTNRLSEFLSREEQTRTVVHSTLNTARNPIQWHCLLQELPEGDPLPRRTVLTTPSFFCCPSSCINLPAVRWQGSTVHADSMFQGIFISQASSSQLPRTTGTANT